KAGGGAVGQPQVSHPLAQTMDGGGTGSAACAQQQYGSTGKLKAELVAQGLLQAVAVGIVTGPGAGSAIGRGIGSGVERGEAAKGIGGAGGAGKVADGAPPENLQRLNLVR